MLITSLFYIYCIYYYVTLTILVLVIWFGLSGPHVRISWQLWNVILVGKAYMRPMWGGRTHQTLLILGMTPSGKFVIWAANYENKRAEKVQNKRISTYELNDIKTDKAKTRVHFCVVYSTPPGEEVQYDGMLQTMCRLLWAHIEYFHINTNTQTLLIGIFNRLINGLHFQIPFSYKNL